MTDTTDLLARFQGVFDRIRDGARDRELRRELPFEQIGWLRDAGFGAVRVPREHGGLGATAPQLFELLVELARADANVAHIWRGHFAFLEVRLTRPDADYRRFWSERAVAGDVVGNAQSEASGAGWAESKTVLVDIDDDTLRLDGEKAYSTGTIFSDWANVTARYGDAHASIAVPVRGDGVAVDDDWDGFGQRLTGTGTTRFDDVRVERRHLTVHGPEDRATSYVTGFYQLFLVAVLAGIARAAVDEAVDYVRGRTRNPLGSTTAVLDDPLAQSVLGRAAADAFAARATVLAAAAPIDAAAAARLAGTEDGAIYEAVDAAAFQAQASVIPLVLGVTTAVFDTGGSSVVARSRALDRHWRNARTIATHNPLKARERALGHREVHGSLPDQFPADTTPPTTPIERDTALAEKQDAR